MEISIEQRLALAHDAVTLDGPPARTLGVRSRFAWIVTLDGSRSAEWSWSTLARAFAGDSRFTT